MRKTNENTSLYVKKKINFIGQLPASLGLKNYKTID